MTETNTSRSATQSTQEPEEEATVDTPEATATDATGSETAIPAATAPQAEPRATPEIFTRAVREPGMPEASPDGTWLAYLFPNESGARELWLSPTTGDPAVRLELPFEPVEDVDPNTGRLVRGPQWSPDGATIALTGMHPDGDRAAVWLVSLDIPEGQPEPAARGAQMITGAGRTEVSDDAAAEAERAAEAETPDTEAPEAAATAAPEDTAEEPTQTADQTPPVAPAVSATRMLADHRDAMRSPRWSPDGGLMLVVFTRDGVDQIGLAEPRLDDTPTMVEPLTRGLLASREPIWSRDGRFIAFTRQHGADERFADVCVFEPRTGEFKNLTGEKDPNVRHSLDWVPGRNLVAFVTRDGDWLGISVINADNKAGWMVTREAGDKWGHRFAPDEPRLVYIRSEGFSTALVERGLHGSSTVALDPGEGVVSTPIWTAPKTVAYGFSAPQKQLGWLAQPNTADAERTVVALPEAVYPRGATLRHPVPFEFEVGPEEQFSGLLYQTDGVSGPVPGAVYVPDGPLEARLAGFQRDEQALASSGLAVLSPVLHGATGFGTAVEDDLAEYADSEIEATDLAAAGEALGAREGVDGSKLAIVGHGYGGALAIVAAGARPGVYSTVVAIDPVTDWALELDQADRGWQQWVTRQYGLPLTHADRYALRSPETFAGVIDAELILVATAAASDSRRAQLETFRKWLDEIGMRYTLHELDTDTVPAALYETGQRLARQMRSGDKVNRDSV